MRNLPACLDSNLLAGQEAAWQVHNWNSQKTVFKTYCTRYCHLVQRMHDSVAKRHQKYCACHVCVCLPSQPQKPHKPTKKPYQNPYKKTTKRPRPPPVPVFAESPFAVPDFAGHSGEFPGFPSFNIADGEEILNECYILLP